jgi:hypothetical protein
MYIATELGDFTEDQLVIEQQGLEAALLEDFGDMTTHDLQLIRLDLRLVNNELDRRDGKVVRRPVQQYIR